MSYIFSREVSRNKDDNGKNEAQLNYKLKSLDKGLKDLFDR